MRINIKDVDINYVIYGNQKGKDILLLHGWGQNIEMMKFIGDHFEKNNRIIILDLPGHGQSDEPMYPWTLDDYSEMLEIFVKELKIDKPIVIGHSFGGRLAIRYSSNNIIDRLVLLASPVRPEKSADSLKVKTLKALKKLPGMSSIAEQAKKYIGSRDYRNASPIMRQVLVNVVNVDLTEYAKQIEEPTILIWGDMDEEARLEDAELLEAVMPDAGLIVLPGTHYAYIENLMQVVNIINSFIGGKK